MSTLNELWDTAWNHPADEIADAAMEEYLRLICPERPDPLPEPTPEPVQESTQTDVQTIQDDPPTLGQGMLF